MGSIALQSQADRFMDEFKDDLNAALRLDGDITMTKNHQSIGFESGWGEIRHYAEIEYGPADNRQTVEVDTGQFVFDCDGAEPDDTVDQLVSLLEIERSEVIKRLVDADIFPANCFSD